MIWKSLAFFYYHSALGRRLLSPIISVRNILIPNVVLLKIRFIRILGYPLNLKHPRTFNEKIQWLKLNLRTPLHVVCSDKFLVREHVREKLGDTYLIPLLLETTNPQNLKPENLPDYPMIIKTNHGSGNVIMIKDKKKSDWPSLQREMRKSLQDRYNSGKGEWHYAKIKPRILVEKLLLDPGGNIPQDYKLYCFQGKVRFIEVHANRFTHHTVDFFDTAWQRIDCTTLDRSSSPPLRPATLEDMLRIAEILANDFFFVRVDLYSLQSKVYFGELTFYPGSGFIKYHPRKWDIVFGEMLQLPLSN
ncbi:ATP-grasp fold amidoligase family protein [Arenibacter sp. GZD96]|uniref:ATP-grasp fold amidoligase family protein n=1 Tax=Aurantibrevibacter litoralis TaxID=3106030 RepID=UPI002B0006C5|nr:ATP-grasp fold amidoligase family protein [Arenibacter sp. GZD-96]MEA1787684.1 ATP-grasp fold amidoligase family protein [Arenibacter sp. GZD-96]